MKLGHISDGDNLFRHVVHPASFKENMFDWRNLFYLKRRDRVLFGSLAWERFVPTIKHVHGYGRRLAVHRPKIDGQRNVYCGFYHLRARAIRGTVSEVREVEAVDVVHHIEAGEIAHTDLKVVLKPNSRIGPTKTEIIARLWQASAGPAPHICKCDLDLDRHPNSELPVAPGGDYRDTRTKRTRSQDTIWFHVLYSPCRAMCWLWRVVCWLWRMAAKRS